MYCDSQGVLDRIKQLPVTKPILPGTTIMDNYDIYVAIHVAH